MLTWNPPYPTTRNPDNPRARIEPAIDRQCVTVGEPIQLHVRLTNTGDTRWLSGTPEQRGTTQLAAQLHRAGPDACIDAEWSRTLLPRDVDYTTRARRSARCRSR